MIHAYGVGITRLGLLGVWRYLENVDEVKSTFSFCVFSEMKSN